MKLKIKSSCIAFGKAVKPGDIVDVPSDGGAGARYLLFNDMAELVKETSSAAKAKDKKSNSKNK